MRFMHQNDLKWPETAFCGSDLLGDSLADSVQEPKFPSRLSDEARAPGSQLRRNKSKSESPPPNGGSAVLSALSSLPAPIRLPLGPEPVAPLASKCPSLAQSEEQEQTFLPPGLTLTMAASLIGSDEGSGFMSKPNQSPRPSLLSGATSLGLASDEASPGIIVGQMEISGAICTRAEWRIEDLRGKLQASMGRPLVSPPFAAWGLPNLRLMVFPDAKEAVKGVRSRERKGLYAAMVRKGPLHGALKLKADCLQSDTVLRFYLTVGAVRCGPFTYDYSEQAIHGCDDFGTDWLKQVDEATGNLAVGVEILSVERYSGTAAVGPRDVYSAALVELFPKGEGHHDQSTGRARGRRGGASNQRRAC